MKSLDCLPDVTDYEESDSPQLRKVWFDSYVVELQSLIGKGRLSAGSTDLENTSYKSRAANTASQADPLLAG